MFPKQLLDHGKIELIDHMGDDQRIAQAARVLVDAPWRELEDPKLIKYMFDNKHTSPFEHVVFTFYVKAPIFVFRQWHRHRMWSYNEVSARYKELPAEYYVPASDHIGKQSGSNHQARIIGGELSYEAPFCRATIERACGNAFGAYETLLRQGCPREIARGVLPVNTYSEMVATVDLHNLMHFIRLRSDEHAQYEIRVYSDAILDIIETIVPITVGLLKESMN